MRVADCRLAGAIVLLAAALVRADGDAVAAGVAPAAEFDRITALYAKEAPSQDVVDRLYDFMEKFPKDPRSDLVQFWVAVTQQKRKFHNEAIKEFGFIVSDFPNSPLVLVALRAQIESYYAIAKPEKAAENYAKILERKPADLATPAGAAWRDALLFTAEGHIQKKEVDAAVALLLQLPDKTESVTRVVQLYLAFDRWDDAMALIRRLPKEQKPLAYRLTLTAYAARPGTTNLYKLLEEVIPTEPDAFIWQVANAIGSRGADEKDKVLRYLCEKVERFKRPAQFELCQLHQDDYPRLIAFIGDYRSGGDVEKVKTMVGELFEKRGEAGKARDAYWLLDNKVGAHFLVAETYYGKLAKTKDLPGGQRELTEIVKRYYSPDTSAKALLARADLEAGPMGDANAAIKTLRELVDRFPHEGQWPLHALFRLGGLLRGQNKHEEAITTAYERVIKDYPNAENVVRQAWMEIAACREEQGDAKRAIALYRIVLRKYPHTAEASAAHTTLEQRYKVPDTDVSD